jgi:hypothetical protein
MTKELMSSPKCRSVKVINNPTRRRSNHRELKTNIFVEEIINYKYIITEKELKRALRCVIDVRI